MIRIQVVAALLALTSFVCASNDIIKPHFIGSQDSANLKDYPYHVAITSKVILFGDKFLGSGVLLTPRWVLTSGHVAKGLHLSWLFYFTHSYQVKAGLHRLSDKPVQQERIQKAVFHDFYHGTDGDNDLALLKVTGPGFVLNEFVGFVGLPTPGAKTEGSVIVTGWHVVNKDKKPLQTIQLTIKDNAVCGTALSDPTLIDETNLCVASIDGSETGVCQTDLGAPAVATDTNGKKVLVGVFSWAAAPCGTLPAVFTNIEKYVSWVERTNKTQ